VPCLCPACALPVPIPFVTPVPPLRHSLRNQLALACTSSNPTSDLHSCNLECLDSNAFDFPGASHVTTVNMQYSNFAELPVELLKKMTSLVKFDGQYLTNLKTLPARFFSGQTQLKVLNLRGSTNLGAQEDTRLPDGLFQGLTSLEDLTLENCQYKHLPDMSGLTALKTFFSPSGGQLHMSDEESESKFDGLVSTEAVALTDQSLTRVPSIKNMKSLVSLWLESNKITKIFPGDFEGATRLTVLTLGGNKIVSVAAAAFVNLAVFRVKPEELNLTKSDGTPFQDQYGIGAYS